jgi:hypothetical protein
MSGNSAETTTLLTVGIVALIVLRFAFRELRPQVVRARTLWGRPGLFAILTLLVGYESLQREPQPLVLLLSVAVSVVIGLIVGAGVIRFTTFAPAPKAAQPAVLAQGSWQTIVVWVFAIALRFGARGLLRGEGIGELTLNAALFALMAGAFAFVAFSFGRAIRVYRVSA